MTPIEALQNIADIVRGKGDIYGKIEVIAEEGLAYTTPPAAAGVVRAMISKLEDLCAPHKPRGISGAYAVWPAEVVQIIDIARAALTTPPAAAGVVRASQAARDVLAERHRQITDEGWTPEHDDEHQTGELARAAAYYTLHSAAAMSTHAGVAASLQRSAIGAWPFDNEGKASASTERRNCVKAAALLIAQIEQIDRASIVADRAQRGEPAAIAESWPNDRTPLGIVPLVAMGRLPEGTKLYTHPPADCGVPDGWKLVPLEPTKGMLAAAEHAGVPDATASYLEGVYFPFRADEIKFAYAAMLAAAPTHPKG